MLITLPYIKRDTPIHRLDPRAKLLLLLAYGLAAAQTSNVWLILAGFVGAACYYALARLKWSETRRAWLFIIFLNVILVFGNYFLSGGAIVQGIDLSHQHQLFSLPFLGFLNHPPYIGPKPLVFSVESITYMLTMGLRNFSIAFLAVAIPYTTNPGQIGVAFKQLGLPDQFAYAIDLSFRFLPTLARDFSVTLDAQRARGFELDKLRGGIFGRIARLAPLVVPIVIGSVVGAEDIVNAMELRCFGVGRRTWLTELQTRPVDRLLMALAIAVFVLVTALNILGNFYASGPLHLLHEQGLPAFLLR
ncbi:MAG: energy-coupling factor transporter transmembrane protein EcfT [Thermogemmatispora sp.]|uniref:energy-coupling factor transporter transmembrane component T family protein n=1 Tax=Thermogemmatispora sp. TaxID=1968838 RepID=UPI00260C2AA6|nr:energy-coupling factor transporter transmembrane component T [Thermogemmatispora sp.]MBX5458424.1 energy-coupling factor transporter transmembrane protein EcfT [Thermogemmatispora sp.]